MDRQMDVLLTEAAMLRAGSADELTRHGPRPPFGLAGVNPYFLNRLATVTLSELSFDGIPWEERQCAVVGNAGILTNSSLGAEIDAHSVVIRMNGALTKGFERDVGGKTSLTLFHPDISMPIQHSARPFLFWWVCLYATLDDGRSLNACV
ncbi:hypothetical protein CYMTET_21299 [Cymbomonas tetramitiformis]|uniref:Uncharacterized protein n=1 Tax=Cymbomonas tetramitiformis TaxID=36881 RepID=A0AAE0G2A5_9CHLO|nr:hypothetical protein CYMTET_21299 [Cymbomonas tetramitiformis]